MHRTLCVPSHWGGRWELTNQDTRLYWIIRGNSLVEHADWRQPLLPGKVYLIPAHMPSSYSCDEPTDIFWMHLGLRDLGSALRLTGLQRVLSYPVTDEPWMWSIWKRAWGLFSQREDLTTVWEMDALIRLLLAPFITEALASAEEDRCPQLSRFHAVLAYIEQHCGERLTLAHLAEVMHLQPTYFSNLFTRQLGESPLTYINRVRVEQAKRLLWQTDLPLQAIAQQVGLSDASYCTRIFKRLTGITPGLYRTRRPPILP